MGKEMTSKERLERAWNFQEPDRVPIEMNISAEAAKDSRSAAVRELMSKYVDRFYGWSPNWGWLGNMPYTSETKEIENRPGEYRRVQHIIHTPVGDFDAIHYYPVSTTDYAWEKHYISSPDDLRRLRDAPYYPLSVDVSSYHAQIERIGERGLVVVSVPNPFGLLVRATSRKDFFSWLILERTLMHDVFSVLFDHVVKKLEYLLPLLNACYFSSSGQELTLPPWMSPEMFEEYVAPYDSKIYGLIRKYGGKTRIHCHGNAMEYLERFWKTGIDGVEPCEPPPQGDVILKEAKRRVGDRMLLCGNIPSQNFRFTHPDETEELVKQAIRDAAPGGGFILRTTGGSAGTWMVPGLDLGLQLEHCERLIEAGIKYGKYPIHL